MKSHLTESSLNSYLTEIYNVPFINNKTVPNSNCMLRPDYRNDELMLIVEFDGYMHYCNTKTILNDSRKRVIYGQMGYNIIRIPYFIQMCEELVNIIFKQPIKIPQEYPHGFISDKAMLPCDFNELGIAQFKNDLTIFNFAKEQIVNSLKDKLLNGKLIDEILPQSLHYIL